MWVGGCKDGECLSSLLVERMKRVYEGEKYLYGEEKDTNTD
jgi:hypothetical protein